MRTCGMNYSMMGNRLKRIMKREQVTAYQLCKDLRIDPGNFSKFIHGKANLSLDKLEMVAGYLGYDLDFVKRDRSRKER